MQLVHNASSAFYAPRVLLFPAPDWHDPGMGKSKKKRGKPNRIATRRQAKSLNQEQLGALVQRSQETIVRYESGETDIPSSVLYAIAAALNCTVLDLVDTLPSLVDEIADEAKGLPPEVQQQALRLIKALKPA